MPELQINAPSLTALHQIRRSLIPISVTLFIKLFFFFFSSWSIKYCRFLFISLSLCHWTFRRENIAKGAIFSAAKETSLGSVGKYLFFTFSPVLQQPMPSILCQLQGSVFPYTNINSYKSLCGTACTHPYTFICLGIDSAAK